MIKIIQISVFNLNLEKKLNQILIENPGFSILTIFPIEILGSEYGYQVVLIKQ